jgi:hypothetical protein
MDWLRQGRIQVKDLADVRSPREAQEVYQALLAGKETRLTTLFDWRKL